MIKLRIHIPILFLLLSAEACKSRKESQKNTPDPPVAVNPSVDTLVNEKCKIPYHSAEALTELMKKSEFDYQYANGKFHLKLDINGESQQVNVAVRVKKDSLIWLSFSVMGIDAGRALITRDTVKIRIDLTEKKYFIGDFSYINKLLHADLDFDILQALLFGNSTQFQDEKEHLRGGKDKENCHYILSTLRKRRALKLATGVAQAKKSYQTFILDPQTFKIMQLELEDLETFRKMKVQYSNFQVIDKYSVPLIADFEIAAEKKIKANIQYSKLVINEVVNFPFSIPANYEAIEFKPQH